MSRSRHPLRRLVLGALGLAAVFAPALQGGCAAGFSPISKIDGLRVLSIAADQPYAQPGDTVTLKMTWTDEAGKKRTPTILWIGGCFNPTGDQYYGCYKPLAQAFQDPGSAFASGLVKAGPELTEFSLKLPDDLISSRPPPAEGLPYYGVAYIFFAVCAGQLRPVGAEGESAAGSFPIGCFDDEGNRLGADAFVPGYTQVYAFADQRANRNPVITAMTLMDDEIPADVAKAPEVATCSVSEDDRLGPPGCGRPDPAKECDTYDVSVKLDEASLEADPAGFQADGTPLREIVWVDYFTDRGSFQGDAKLVVDAVTGTLDGWEGTWIPPSEPGPARLWAVVHDARGGQAVIERTVQVVTP